MHAAKLVVHAAAAVAVAGGAAAYDGAVVLVPASGAIVIGVAFAAGAVCSLMTLNHCPAIAISAGGASAVGPEHHLSAPAVAAAAAVAAAGDDFAAGAGAGAAGAAAAHSAGFAFLIVCALAGACFGLGAASCPGYCWCLGRYHVQCLRHRRRRRHLHQPLHSEHHFWGPLHADFVAAGAWLGLRRSWRWCPWCCFSCGTVACYGCGRRKTGLLEIRFSGNLVPRCHCSWKVGVPQIQKRGRLTGCGVRACSSSSRRRNSRNRNRNRRKRGR